MSSSLDVTVTLSAVAVPGLAEGEGAEAVVAVVEAGGVEAASCAVAMFVSRNSAPNQI
jgi:cobalamin biosynthesis protein CobD/CbiB